jgi:hypothetical protein
MSAWRFIKITKGGLKQFAQRAVKERPLMAQSGHPPSFGEAEEANSRCTGRQRATPQGQRCADMC